MKTAARSFDAALSLAVLARLGGAGGKWLPREVAERRVILARPRAHSCAWLSCAAAFRRNPCRLIPHRHRARAELPPAHQLQVEVLR